MYYLIFNLNKYWITYSPDSIRRYIFNWKKVITSCPIPRNHNEQSDPVLIWKFPNIALRKLCFHFLSQWMGYDRGDSFSFDFLNQMELHLVQNSFLSVRCTISMECLLTKDNNEISKSKQNIILRQLQGWQLGFKRAPFGSNIFFLIGTSLTPPTRNNLTPLDNYFILFIPKSFSRNYLPFIIDIF